MEIEENKKIIPQREKNDGIIKIFSPLARKFRFFTNDVYTKYYPYNCKNREDSFFLGDFGASLIIKLQKRILIHKNNHLATICVT